MTFKTGFDSPTDYTKFTFYDIGCSPKLTLELIREIKSEAEKIKKIFVVFYLFNNELLYNELVELSKIGIEVNVITIPIEGYDDTKPQKILNYPTGKVVNPSITKYALAKIIFGQQYKEDIPNFNFFIFPHIYLRSPRVKTFSRGNMPYSLHIKMFYIEYRDNQSELGITSSNFAVRDLIKEENIIQIINTPENKIAIEQFLTDLIEQSIPIKEFDFKGDYTAYQIQHRGNPTTSSLGFIAPFYRDSGLRAEEVLLDLINNSKKSIKVVGQHICPIGYTLAGSYCTPISKDDIVRSGLIEALINKNKEGILIDFASQTFSSGDSKKDEAFRSPENKGAFIKFYNKIKELANVKYYVNPNIHSKYWIIDENVFISSFNYTPTQFIYLDNVDIEEFANNPGKTYRGKYSEVGIYTIISNETVLDSYNKNFQSLIQQKITKQVK